MPRRDPLLACMDAYRHDQPLLRVGRCRTSGTGAGSLPGTSTERRGALAEALRFGEPVVQAGGSGFLWAMPLLVNSDCTGAIIAGIAEDSLFPEGSGAPAIDVRAACARLRELVLAAGLSNAALLDQRREEHRREAERAGALHRVKSDPDCGLREVSLREEVALIAAVRAGDQAAARGILNRVLVGIYHHSAGAPDLCQAMLLELLVMMARCAAEAGGPLAPLYRCQLACATELLAAQDEEALARWLRRAVERLFAAAAAGAGSAADQALRRALGEMERRHGEPDLGRDEVARSVGLSPTAFSRLVKTRLGRGFNDHLNHLRIGHAKSLLDDGTASLLAIALDCGFKDASYFTKVFRRHVRMTPSDYRRRNRR